MKRQPPPLYWEDAELGLTADGRVFRKGGSRPNAGRKPSGRKPFLIRLKPEAHGPSDRFSEGVLFMFTVVDCQFW
jgi:hypothetical protein